MLQISKIEKVDELRQVSSAGWTWWKVAVLIRYCELSGIAWKSTKVKQWSYVVNWGRSPASTARDNEPPQKARQGREHGETSAAKDGAQQGNCQRTKKGESSRLPKNEPLTGTLERRHQPQYQPYRIWAETREGRYWERSTRKRQTSKGARNKDALRGAKLSASLRGARERRNEKNG